MEFTNQTKLIMLIVGILVLIHFLRKQENKHEMVETVAPKVAKVASSTWKKSSVAPDVRTPKKVSSYKDGRRGGSGDIDAQFVSPLSGDGTFAPFDADEGMFASYSGSGKKANEDPEDLFDPNHLSPQEVKDWFEVYPQPVDIKNPHLINAIRPVGIDTIKTSRKNANFDIRGTIPNPQIVVSPWNNTTITPDFNLVGLCK
jgi:hypothetical protein